MTSSFLKSVIHVKYNDNIISLFELINKLEKTHAFELDVYDV